MKLVYIAVVTLLIACRQNIGDTNTKENEVTAKEKIYNFNIDTLPIDRKKVHFKTPENELTKESEHTTEDDRLSNIVTGNEESLKPYYDDHFDTLSLEVTFIEQKIQEYFDLLLLEKKHPEYKEEVRQQLDSFSDFNVLIDIVTDSISVAVKDSKWIQNDQFNNSTQKIYYTRNGIPDSILVRIKQTYLSINGEPVFNQKIRFEKLE